MQYLRSVVLQHVRGAEHHHLRECRKDGVTGIWSEKVSNGSPESRTNVRTIECLDD